MTPKSDEIVRRITEARAELMSAVEGLDASQLGYRPAANVWCITDVLHHLALTEEASVTLLGRMLRRTREESIPPEPDPNGSVVAAFDETVAVADRARALAPDIVAPKTEIEAAEALSRLQVSRLTLLTSFEALAAFDLSKLTHPHPFFGELDTYQWVLVTGWHERRHTRQIERIKKNAGFPKAHE